MTDGEREFPPQQQERPGETGEMTPTPRDEMRGYRGGGRLAGRRALVTGGDSGIGRAVAIAGDLSTEDGCAEAVRRTVEELGGLDVLVNNIAYQNPVDAFEEITTEQWDRTFRTNVSSYFWTTKAALAHIPDGGAIVNTS